MRKLCNLFAVFIISTSMATAVSPVKEKRYNFTAEQQVKVSVLAKEYMERDGMDIKAAITKAEEDVAATIVDLRIGSPSVQFINHIRTDLNPWPANHAAWMATDTYPGSIEVDRDPAIHNYKPSELVKKVLLKTYSAADGERIQNVRFKGWNGVAGGGDAWMDNNPNLASFGIGNRGLAYFNRGTSDFELKEGLLLSTGDSWEHEGPNECPRSFCSGVGYDGVTRNPQPVVKPFDIDILRNVIIESAEIGGLLEFDFQPVIGKATFKYIFGSEEYPEFSNSEFNDGFGFFVSCPYETAAESNTEGTDQTDINASPGYLSTSTVTGVTMPQRYKKGKTVYNGKEYNTYSQYNIAQLPNGDPVSVNWTNWGFRDKANRMQGGGNSGSPDVALGWQYAINNCLYSNCMPWDTIGVRGGATPIITIPGKNIYTSGGHNYSPKAMNPEYHRAIPDSSAMMELDGITVKLTAVADSLIPGKWYHLKMVVCQKDMAHGDAVFLSDLDLGSTEGLIDMKYSGIAAIDSMAYDADRNEFMNLYEDCTYPLEIHSDPAAVGGAIALTYIGMPSSALQDIDGNKLFDSDTIPLTELKDTLIHSEFKVSPKFEGFQNGQFVGLHVSVVGGGGDTVFYKRLYTGITYNDSITTKEQFMQPTKTQKGYLHLNIEGGSPTLSRKIIDGTDDNSGWKPISEDFTQWELFTIGDSADILLYESKKCRFDTVKIRIMPYAPVTIQRYIKIPSVEGITTAPMAGFHYAEGHHDFTFYARFNGQPSEVQAIGLYKDTVNLVGIPQTEGDFAGSYKYVIRQVTQPYNIEFVTTTTSGDLTYNEDITNQMVWTNGSNLYISSESSGIASIYNLAGVLQKQIVVNGTVCTQLSRGFYIIALNNKQYKVMIK